MFFRILKRDLKRKKSMNIILLIFIILATTFLASSVNNLITVSQSVDYFMEKGKAPDYLISAFDRAGNEELEKWLNSSKLISSYDLDRSIIVPKEAVKIKVGDEIKDFEPFGENLLQVQPKKYGKLLDDRGEEINMEAGEIALSLGDKSKNNLQVGDKVVITIGDVKKEFTIKLFSKDAVFGSSMNEMKRVLINEEDYEAYKASKEVSFINNYYIMSEDTAALEKEFKSVDCNTIINLDRSFLNKSFALDMMTSAVLIVVSLCLILIAFLILRFTIIFTLQDDFKEIGVMKAIGLREFDIKKVYLIKYLAITVIGVAIGLALSFPFGNVMLKQTSGNILMKSSTGNVLINIICSILIVFIVLLFCYMCTRKLNKFSAIDAIRNGSNGESFKGKSRLKLSKYKNIKVPFFMAVNDILYNFRRFVVLVLTFCIGTVLIIIPLNTINTLKDGNIIKLFAMEYSDVLIEPDYMDKYIAGASKEDYLKDVENLEKSFKAMGIDMKLHGQLIYRLKFYGEDKNNALSICIFQAQGNSSNSFNVLKGKMPVLINEAAITEISAEKLKVDIGDTIYTQIGNEKKEFIITGLYESMNNLGESVRLSPKMDIDFKYLSGLLPLQGNFREGEDPAVLTEKLREKYPSYTFKNSQEYVSRYIGSSLSQLDSMKNLIVLVVICINALITILMIKTFLTKEKGEVAMLKSVGFRNSDIRFWQSVRISIVLLAGVILGSVLSKILGPLTAGQVFGMLGVHNVVFKVLPLEVYMMYPIIILAVTTIIAYLSAGAVKKIDLKEINNME